MLRAVLLPSPLCLPLLQRRQSPAIAAPSLPYGLQAKKIFPKRAALTSKTGSCNKHKHQTNTLSNCEKLTQTP